MRVPENIRERYLKRRRADLERCLYLFEVNNLLELKGIGHRIKGSAASFGFHELSKIARDIELFAECDELNSLRKTLNKFSLFLAGNIN